MKNIIITGISVLLGMTTFSQVERMQEGVPGAYIQKEIKQKYHRARIFYGEPSGLAALANQGVTVDHGNKKPGVYIESDFSDNDLGIARMMGMTVEVLIEDVSAYYKSRNAKDMLEGIPPAAKNGSCTGSGATTYNTPNNWELGSMGGFYTYSEMLMELDAMAAQYPNLISLRAPISTFQTLNGNSIYWVKISDNPNVDEAEPEILYDAIHHAREPMAMQQLIYYMWYLLENYGTDLEVQAIVDNSELFFIPVLNPDGYIHNCNQDSINGGEMWRKNRRNHGNGDYGVDNNRNYDFHENGTSMWGTTGVSSNTNNDTYPGTGPFSEVENLAMKWFCENHNFKMALNNHSWDNSLLYPYGYANNKLTPDNATYIAIGGVMTANNGLGMQAKLSSLLYPASGDSDDWMYGDDLVTKPKIFSFTPEIGDVGFWPAISAIENTCNSMVYTNLMAAHLITNYAEAKDVSPSQTIAQTGFFNYEIQRMGIEEPANFTVAINPVSANITAIGAMNIHNGMSMLQTDLDSISYTLDPSISIGDNITYELLVDNGYYIETIVVNKIYGQGMAVFTESGDNVAAWTVNGTWGSTTSEFYSPGSSIGDSPTGEYDNGADEKITLANPIDLSNATSASFSFYAMWNIEASYDYVQVEVSTNGGSSWIPQCGKYTGAGSANQDQGAPLYDGVQSTWVKEEISLSDYIGSSILIRFQLVSDNFVTEDGFFFDDFEVSVIGGPNSIDDENARVELHSYPNPAAEQVTIAYDMPTGIDNASIVITNEIGQEVFKTNISSSKGTELISTASLPSGIYFYSIQSNEVSSVTKKLLITK
jgi:carboxypeptidase T